MPKIHQQKTETDWKALHYFNLYRIFIAIFFLTLVFTSNIPEPLGEYKPDLFSLLCKVYLILAFLIAFFSQHRNFSHQSLVLISIFIDIIFLSLMMYASGGLKSGFGLLLVISVASGSILSTQKIAFFIAAIATIFVLSVELYAYFFESASRDNYTQSSILGLAFFITSLTGNYLSTRLRASEVLAERRAAEIQSLAELNEQIIDRMQSGIIAIDNNFVIQLMNRSAKELLNYPYQSYGQPLDKVSENLVDLVEEWQVNDVTGASIVTLDDNIELKVGIAEILNKQQPTNSIFLIFLDDATKVRQQAQNIKLESLGRLAASIAHEVRNPLGAISHAGQLLKESSSLAKSDERLTEIIQTQSNRVNSIIENVLSISRRQQPNIEEIDLLDWLEKFKNEFIEQQRLQEDDFIISTSLDSLVVKFDSTQLQQVLWNLCQNAFRYSQTNPLITIECNINENNQRPYMDIIDTGSGINENEVEKLFEPFFTTDKEGTGLGLYISRELCEINQANLYLENNSNEGCRFRIVFSYPE